MRLGRRATRWVLRHKMVRGNETRPVSEMVAEIKPALTELVAGRDQLGGGQGVSWRDRVGSLIDAGLPETLAQRCANAAELARLLSTIEVSRNRGCTPAALAATEVSIGEALNLDLLSAQLSSMDCQSHWQAMERDALLDEITTCRSTLGASVLLDGEGGLHKWQSVHGAVVERWRQVTDEARHTAVGDFSMYAMLTRKLGDLFGSALKPLKL